MAIVVRKEYQCSKCDFRTPERSELTSHMRSAHSKIGYSLTRCIKSCNMTFSTSEELIEHKKIMHPKRWVCKLCSRGYDAKKLFCDHVMKHHSDRRSSPSDPTMSHGEILLFAEENSFVKQYMKVKFSQQQIADYFSPHPQTIISPAKVPQIHTKKRAPQSTCTKAREEIKHKPELPLPKPAWQDEPELQLPKP